MEPSNNITFISFGYRCSSAGILKKLKLKQESYPFDWLISKLSIITHCLNDDFSEFLKVENYLKRHTNTYEMTYSNTGFICDEYILFNKFYQPEHMMNEENTYKYYLAMNHRDITQQNDYEYFVRCITRFRELIQSTDTKKYIHIAPLITHESYVLDQKNIFNTCEQFDDFIFNHIKGNISGFIFIMVRTENVNNFKAELLHTCSQSKTEIYVIYTNRDFKDAGETFIGNYHNEQQFIENVILNSTNY